MYRATILTHSLRISPVVLELRNDAASILLLFNYLGKGKICGVGVLSTYCVIKISMCVRKTNLISVNI